jgi:hypothetical protein
MIGALDINSGKSVPCYFYYYCFVGYLLFLQEKRHHHQVTVTVIENFVFGCFSRQKSCFVVSARKKESSSSYCHRDRGLCFFVTQNLGLDAGASEKSVPCFFYYY